MLPPCGTTAVPVSAQILTTEATWSTVATPAPAPAGHNAPFFRDGVEPRDVLVAEVEGTITGYVRLTHPYPLASSAHVLHVSGIAVAPAFQRRGVGTALLAAAEREARGRGARRLTLRVLAHNAGARHLYERAGFVVEGVMCGEFLLDGQYRDDVLMALDLTPMTDSPRSGTSASGASQARRARRGSR